MNYRKMCNIPSLNFTEEIRYVPSRRIRFGIGAVPDLDSEQTPYPRCLSLSTLCPALQTLAILRENSWKTEQLMLGKERYTLLYYSLSDHKTSCNLLLVQIPS